MNPSRSHRFAVAMVRFAIVILPPAIRSWGQAMLCEVEAIESGEDAIAFASSCLGFAIRQALLHHLHRESPTMTIGSDLFRHPRRTAMLCAIAATGLGLVYMGLADAPSRYLVLNAAALTLGLALAGLLARLPQLNGLGAGAVGLALGTSILLTTLCGTTVGGATRWISFAGLPIQPSLILLPLIAIRFARNADGPSLAGLVLASLALAMQPDRAMSGALAAGMLAMTLARPGWNAGIAFAAAGCAFVVTMLRPDTQPAMPYVDQILYTAFDVHPAVGMAVFAGSALMIVPAIAGFMNDGGSRETYAVFGAVWLAIIVSAALGNYPTPLVGYGGSAIIGYTISLLGLPKRAYAAPKPRGGENGQRTEYDQQNRRLIASS